MTVPKVADKHEKFTRLSLEESVSHILEETRMLLPGLQALFGFQLIAVFNEGFSKLSGEDRFVYLLSLICSLVSMTLLMTPAAFDRQYHSHHATEAFVRLSSRLVAIALCPLMAALALDTYLVVKHILENEVFGLITAAGLTILCTCLWYVLPRLAEWSENRR
jgi:hypothetical protein